MTGDEASILEFLQKEVAPIFKNLVANYGEMKGIANTYWDALDSDLG